MSASVLTGALVGAGGGLAMSAIVIVLALNPPENYRRNMGYKRFSEYDSAGRRRVMIAVCAFGLLMVVAAGALGAWALPALP